MKIKTIKVLDAQAATITAWAARHAMTFSTATRLLLGLDGALERRVARVDKDLASGKPVAGTDRK